MSDAGAPAPATALAGFRGVVGVYNVIVDDDELARASTATFATTQRALAIVRPASADEVAACVRVARAHKTPLYPVSAGRNWGYGSRVPPRGDAVILDLGRLDRVVAYDEELATVTVEPGVTQRQLCAFLDARGAKLWMDPTASSAHASVLANALERGHGFTPYADHAATLHDLEVVLGTGDVIHTGYRAHGDHPLAALDAYGFGPQLDGLFCQSNLGIVTRASVWLLPAPDEVELGVMRLADETALGAAIDAFRPLRLSGTVRSGPRFSNVYRGLQYQGYPWAEMDGQTPLPLERALALGARAGVAPWSGLVGLYGTRAEVDAQRARVRAALAGICEVAFWGDKDIAALPPSAGATQLRGQMAIFKGRVVGEGAAAALPYWRKRDRSLVPRAPQGDAPGRAAQPEQDRCGTIWTTAVTPMRGADVKNIVDIVTTHIIAAGFEPDLSCIALRDRALSYHISVTYDRDVDGDDERALACSAHLRERLRAEGYHPYRLGIHSMESMLHAEPTYVDALCAIKGALDPDDVIAPGRYIPQRAMIK